MTTWILPSIACLCLNFPGFPNMLGKTFGFASLIFIYYSLLFDLLILAKLSPALGTFQVSSPKPDSTLPPCPHPRSLHISLLLFLQVSDWMSHYQRGLLDTQFKQSSWSLCVSTISITSITMGNYWPVSFLIDSSLWSRMQESSNLVCLVSPLPKKQYPVHSGCSVHGW